MLLSFTTFPISNSVLTRVLNIDVFGMILQVFMRGMMEDIDQKKPYTR